MLKALLLGVGRVPGRAIEKFETLQQEEEEGVVKSKSTGKPRYKLKPGDAEKRFFGLRPNTQVEAEEREDEVRRRRKERVKLFKERSNE